jgi:2-polyprenyl-6-methoxyphenol hydroxylase-like FAD-dependent oxidoreductase
MTTPILIIGAGPVGLTMAAALNHYDVPCRIIDKSTAPSDKSKALAVWCRTMELLDGLDLADRFVQTGLKLTGGSMFAGGQRLVHLDLTSRESKFGFPLMIPQNQTEHLLQEHLASKGITVERQVELLSMTDTGAEVNCILRHPDGREEAVSSPYVVGCDGAHSTVRHSLGMEFTGHAEPNDWMLADVHIEGPLAKDEVSIYWHETGVVAFFPIDHNRFRAIMDLGASGSHVLPSELSLPEVQAKVDLRGPGGLTLSAPIWLAYFRINERKVSNYRQGRVMLAGDAAHIHSPAGGQGMNTGMQDAFNLAWKLALIHQGKGQPEPLLESYSLERSAVGDEVLKNAARFTTMATLRSPVARWLRNHIVPILGSFHVVKDKIRNDWFELSINYRSSPLTGECWNSLANEVQAGDRLCDTPVASLTTGHQTNLFSAIHSNRHTLLLIPGSTDAKELSQLTHLATQASEIFPDALSTHIILTPDTTPDTTPNLDFPAWLDTDNTLHHKFNAIHPTLLLIRPDGYIAYRNQPAAISHLLSFMDTYLIRKK